jgi:hypothetical protein
MASSNRHCTEVILSPPSVRWYTCMDETPKVWPLPLCLGCTRSNDIGVFGATELDRISQASPEFGSHGRTSFEEKNRTGDSATPRLCRIGLTSVRDRRPIVVQVLELSIPATELTSSILHPRLLSLVLVIRKGHTKTRPSQFCLPPSYCLHLY